MKIRLKLFATLTDFLPDPTGPNELEIDVGEKATVADVIAHYGLPQKRVHLVLVNGLFVPPEARAGHGLKENDVLAIWPPIAGG
jgi:thiamine biosynthesis protein ThiS